MPVNSPRREYSSSFPKWQRARDCFEGSDAVKLGGVRYLPALDSHKRDGLIAGGEKYEEYKLRALFFNAMGRTVEGLAGALFQVPPTIKAPLDIMTQLEDVTMSGVVSAELFGLQTTRELLITGREGILVDVPRDAATPRPYWAGYRAEDILSWKVESTAGQETLVRVVLREFPELQDPKDPFIIDSIEQYRVLTTEPDGIYKQIVFRKLPSSEQFVSVEEIIPTRRGDALRFIPFIFVNPFSVSAGIQKPPLDDLVHVNLSHYRTSADLEHGLHWTALPTPWVSGALATREGEPLHIGSGVAWSLEKEGRAGMLEYTGQGLGALEKAEERKRRMMAVLGARLLEDQPSIQIGRAHV